MSKKIYVGNLSYAVTEDDLRQAFEAIGEVQSVKVIKDEATGRSKGFGFVEMTSDEDADRAISTLDGTKLLDRAMKVSEARPQAERGGREHKKSFGKGRDQSRW
ncbi:MAG: RNA-binding protein [Nitrospiraceae bacterium]|nr:RNA-binding protein [Nitrospiraceae bacterium]